MGLGVGEKFTRGVIPYSGPGLWTDGPPIWDLTCSFVGDYGPRGPRAPLSTLNTTRLSVSFFVRTKGNKKVFTDKLIMLGDTFKIFLFFRSFLNILTFGGS